MCADGVRIGAIYNFFLANKVYMGRAKKIRNVGAEWEGAINALKHDNCLRGRPLCSTKARIRTFYYYYAYFENKTLSLYLWITTVAI